MVLQAVPARVGVQVAVVVPAVVAVAVLEVWLHSSSAPSACPLRQGLQ